MLCIKKCRKSKRWVARRADGWGVVNERMNHVRHKKRVIEPTPAAKVSDALTLDPTASLPASMPPVLVTARTLRFRVGRPEFRLELLAHEVQRVVP